MKDHEPYRKHMDMTPGAAGIVKDEFGWWLAYHIRSDGSVNWLGVTTKQAQAEAWVQEELEMSQ